MSSFLGLEISYLTKRNSLMAVFCNPPLRSLLSVEGNIVREEKVRSSEDPGTSDIRVQVQFLLHRAREWYEGAAWKPRHSPLSFNQWCPAVGAQES